MIAGSMEGFDFDLALGFAALAPGADRTTGILTVGPSLNHLHQDLSIDKLLSWRECQS